MKRGREDGRVDGRRKIGRMERVRDGEKGRKGRRRKEGR